MATKFYIGRGQHSDLMLLLARTTPLDQVKKKTDGAVDFPGRHAESRGKELDIRPIRTTMNHSLTEIYINDLFIPEENLVGELGKGFRYILDSMNAERLLIAGGMCGRCPLFHRTLPTGWANQRELFRPGK